MIMEQATLPLNDFFIKKIYEKPSAFEGLKIDNKSTIENLFGGYNRLQFSPTAEWGANTNRMTRDAVKTASVIDSLSFIHKDDAISILKEAQDNSVRSAFEKNGNLDVLEKIAKKAKENTKEAHLNNFLRSLDIDRQMVYNDSWGNYFVKQANSRVNKVWTTQIDSVEAQELDDYLLNSEKSPKFEKIAQKTEHRPFMVKKGEEGALGWVKNGEFEKLSNFYVSDIKNLEERPDFTNVSINGDENKRITFTKEGSWVFTDKKLESKQDFEKIAGSKPKIGDFGMFVTEKTASTPFEITGMVKLAKIGGWEIKGEEGLKKVSYYPIRSSGSEFTPHDTEKNAFYVPKEAKWVPLKEKNDKLAELRDFEAKIKVEGLNGFKKTALYVTDDEKYRENPKSINDGYLMYEIDALLVKEGESQEIYKNASSAFDIHEIERDKGGLFNFRGPEFAKYAQENPIRNLSLRDAKWTAIHCGATEKDVEKIASLNPNQSHTLEGKIESPKSLDEFSHQLSSNFDKLAGKKLKLSKLLVKHAAVLTDKTSVDAVLSLNLLRKKNVQEYLASIPIFEQTLENLSKLLLASRLGLEHTSPEVIKTALEAITETLVQLYEIEATIKEVK